MATDDYPKTFVRRGREITVSTASDEVAAKFEGFTEKKSARTSYAGSDVFNEGDAS